MSADVCHNGHPFVPGVSTDHAPGESDPRWCNTCGEARKPPLLIEQSKTTGEWSWFCEREGCHWSGHGWMTERGARREGECHDCKGVTASQPEPLAASPSHPDAMAVSAPERSG